MRARAIVAFGLRDHRVLGLAVVFVVARPREANDGFRVANVPVLLLARVAVRAREVLVAHEAVAVVLLVGQGAQRAVVEHRGRAVVERERGRAVAADVREAVGGQRAAAAAASPRAPRRALVRARHEEHAGGGVKL